MSTPFIGEIRLFAGNFPPAGWAFCDGQLLAISENDALFNLIGTTYGGDGQSTFALPDLRSRIPIHMGQGAGLSNRILAENGGAEAVTLTTNQIPNHAHNLIGTSSNASSGSPSGNLLANPASIDLYRPGSTPSVNLAASAIGPQGGSQPHENMQPFLCISFIISLFGIYPQQG